MNTFLCVMALLGTEAEEKSLRVEEKVLQALANGSKKELRTLEASILKLKAEERRDLKVKIRGKTIQFRFDGIFLAEEFQPGIFEYVMGVKGKAYESFLTIKPPEMKRLQRLGAALEALSKAKKGKSRWSWTMTLIWSHGDRIGVVPLEDVLRLLSPEEKQGFYKQLRINEFGLCAGNVKADPAAFPKGRAIGQVLVDIQLK